MRDFNNLYRFDEMRQDEARHSAVTENANFQSFGCRAGDAQPASDYAGSVATKTLIGYRQK